MSTAHYVTGWFELGPSLRLFWKTGLVVLCELAAMLSAANGYCQSREWSTPRELLTTDSQAFLQWLEAARPEPVAAHAKVRALSALPAEGEINVVDDSEQQKLAAVRELLRAIGRDAAYEIKVVDIPMARVGVYERAAILISEHALTVLEAEDLQALVAHETGHEYFTADYDSALGRQDKPRLKQLELICDAVAIATLERLHIDSARLVSAVEKITRYNQLHRPGRVDESGYPTLSERRAFARQVLAWLAHAR